MGNVVLWKPAETTILGSYMIYKILEEAGLPPGVIQFLPGNGATVLKKKTRNQSSLLKIFFIGQIGNEMLNSADLAGVHFTGSTRTFNGLWKKVAENLDRYKTYPRIVGETGGKNFHFVHKSCGDQIDNIVLQTYSSWST